MARAINKLSAFQVKALDRPGRHSDGGGLYISISTDGRRRWVFLYSRDGKQRELGLGSAGQAGVSLAAARAKAAEARALLTEGRDPLAVWSQPAPQSAPPFGTYALNLVERIEEGFSNAKHRQQWKNTLETYCAPIWSTPIDRVDTAGVLSCLTPIWKAKPETASRVRGRIERVLNAAKAEKLRAGENPAAWRGHLDATLPKPVKLARGHHKALGYADLPSFLKELRERPALAATALELTILTATRTSEVLGAEWREFDLAAGIWLIPASRMKARMEHRVPLSKRALAILRELSEARTDDDSFVFPGRAPNKPLSNMSMLMLLDRMGRRGVFTVHGFRSAFSDWASEVSPFSAELRETALAHTISNAAERAYRRGDALDKRRQMMEAWARFCEGEAAGNVVALSRKRRSNI